MPGVIWLEIHEIKAPREPHTLLAATEPHRRGATTLRGPPARAAAGPHQKEAVKRRSRLQWPLSLPPLPAVPPDAEGEKWGVDSSSPMIPTNLGRTREGRPHPAPAFSPAVAGRSTIRGFTSIIDGRLPASWSLVHDGSSPLSDCPVTITVIRYPPDFFSAVVAVAVEGIEMSYYNQQQPPIGVPPPQGYPEGYAKDAYPPPGYPAQGYPQPGYPQGGYPPQGYPPAGGYPPPQYAQQPPPQQQSSGPSFMEGW
ncbi:hypothetical protein KSP40_PGU020263 [Platanthera guangdongensis]|uniref:Uncharacterized protein n=1 Tax=Platanthera guangdongensis TaxID=2320717 RepID=A0ABR2LDX6_9ASPA